MLDFFKMALQGSKKYAGREIEQPNTAEVASVDYVLKQNTNYIVPHITTSALMQTSPIGYTIPNPTTLNGIPVNPKILGTSDVLVSDVVKGKGCN